MSEKHSINNSRKTESAPGTVPAEPVSQDIKDAMAPSDWHEYLKYILQNKLSGATIPIKTPENLVSFLKYMHMHSDGTANIDTYGMVRIMIENRLAIDVKKYAELDDPDCRELMHRLKDYVESLQEYTQRLDNRLKAIHELSHAINLIDDPVVKQEITQKCDNALDVHDALFFFYNSMEELRLKFEIEKLKYDQKKSNAPDALSARVAEINDLMVALFRGLGGVAGSVVNQEKKLNHWEGEYPEGLRALGEMAYKDTLEQVGDTLIRLNKAGIKGVDEDIFYARFVFNHSLDKIVADLAKKRNWKRDRSTISRHIADIKLKLKKANINPNMIEKIREIKQH